MQNDKDISEVIEAEAAALEAASEGEEVVNETAEDIDDDIETSAEVKEDPADEQPTEEAHDGSNKESQGEAEQKGLTAPEHWAEDIKAAFNKADAATQQVWLNQQKDFQRGFNDVSQEAARLRDYERQNQGVQSVLNQVIPMWRANGMTPEQGLGQLVQLGVAYATNPADTILHLAKMAGLDMNEVLQEAPYRTSDDIARDNRMQQLEQRLQQAERIRQQEFQSKLESDIVAFQNDTDADGNLKHPFFEEVMDSVTQLYNSGFKGSLEQAYDNVVWTNPSYRQKMMSSIPTSRKPANDQRRIADAQKAQNASNQRVRQARPAPNQGSEMDDLSVDDLVSAVASQLEAGR